MYIGVLAYSSANIQVFIMHVVVRKIHVSASQCNYTVGIAL